MEARMDVHDISEPGQPPREQQLSEANKLASLGALAAGIAHEINNPNHFIRLISQNLRDFWVDIGRILDESYRANETLELAGIAYPSARAMIEKMLAGLEEGSRRIERLVGTLKDYSRLEGSPPLEWLEIAQVVRSAVTASDGLIRASTGHFREDIADNLPKVWGSFSELKLLLVNLISNACQALSGSIQALTVSAFREEAADSLVVAIGAQPAAPTANRPLATAAPSVATGIGLSICQRIVANHSGELSFLSHPGGGTAARVRLPVRQPGSSTSRVRPG